MQKAYTKVIGARPQPVATRRMTLRRCSRGLYPICRAAKTADGPTLAIVGVTGAVGQEFLRVCRSTCNSCSTSVLWLVPFIDG